MDALWNILVSFGVFGLLYAVFKLMASSGFLGAPVTASRGLVVKGNITHVADVKAFNELIGAGKLSVVKHTATWCGPCQFIAPLYAELSLQHAEVQFLEVDVDQAPAIRDLCAVKAMPTFQFYRAGHKIDEFMGADSSKLKATLAKHAR
jgi:thiol-disulfide isomerase/thioredoxin